MIPRKIGTPGMLEITSFQEPVMQIQGGQERLHPLR